MSDNIETLTQLFGLEAQRLEQEERLRDFIARSTSGPLQNALALTPEPLRKYAAASLSEVLKVVLNTPLKDIFARAWNTRRDLLRYRDRVKYPPDKVVDYSIDVCEVRYGYKPKVQLLLDAGAAKEMKLGEPIEFDIAVKLKSKPILKIRDARVIGGRVGTIQATGAVKCEGATLIERKGHEFALPGDLDFGCGFEIGKIIDLS